jgi:4-amino-4-deoxy-L-arabinose transferase-like glycosyltransferase
MLAKGPVTLALFGLPVLSDAIINRRRKPLLSVNWFWGAVFFLLITVPYFWVVETNQPGFLRYFFINENLMRFLVRDYGDQYGAGRETFRGMAVIWALVVTLPWSLFVVFRRPSDWRRARPFASFLLLSVIVITLFWCLTSRVPIAYLLPVVPLFAAYLSTECGNLGISRPALLRFMPWAVAAAVLVLSAVIATVWIYNPKKMPGRAAGPKVSNHYFSYEFYHAPWGKGAPKR